ncbi:MAG: hypothetical protein IJ906_06490 [Oscillospiraceae bacterium]|nr:hypothetical protein [Oscillospiraceae bacterium]
MIKPTRSACISIAALMALLFTACSEKQTSPIPEATHYSYTTAYETTTIASTLSTNSVAADYYDTDMNTEGSFRSAVWIAKDHNTESERFFIFQDDTHGRIVDQQNGQETPFTCTLTGAEKSFVIGAEEAKPVAVIWTDDQHAVIRWGEDKSEALTLLRENGNEPLHFFNNEQLCAMALDYFEKANGIRPEHARTFYNLDEMIAIQLYNTDGSASDTLDWYTVDRYTAEGYNTLNESIRLTETPGQTAPAQTTDAPAQTSVPEQTTAAQTTVFTQPPTVAQTLPPREMIETTETQPAEALPEETAAVSDVLF